MKRHFVIIAVAFFAFLMFQSCGNKATISGTWIQPKGDYELAEEQGFTLLDDGSVLPINMGYREWYAWKQDGDQIIFLGHYTGPTNPGDFSDTLKVVSVTDEELLLKDLGGYEVKYERRK